MYLKCKKEKMKIKNIIFFRKKIETLPEKSMKIKAESGGDGESFQV